jgi:hypothetical protein
MNEQAARSLCVCVCVCGSYVAFNRSGYMFEKYLCTYSFLQNAHMLQDAQTLQEHMHSDTCIPSALHVSLISHAVTARCFDEQTDRQTCFEKSPLM